MTVVNFVSSILSKKIGLKLVLTIGLVGNAILVFCVPYGTQLGKVYLYLIVCGIAFFEGLRMPSIFTLVSLYATAHSLGFTFGVFQVT